ncbi:MAG: hypothetical protein HQK54_13210 [Oligoflexales bacterium]|nr:hypothetical protein [Oligoflexales bacterium]
MNFTTAKYSIISPVRISPTGLVVSKMMWIKDGSLIGTRVKSTPLSARKPTQKVTVVKAITFPISMGPSPHCE